MPGTEKSPAVSVIIPTYNRSRMVVEAVASVMDQDFQDVELIVVDDGSTDDTQERLAPLQSVIRCVRQDNRGVSAARNTGIDHARGALIAFLDSDDLWRPGKLACQVRFFAAHPGALVCQTDEIWIRNGVRVNKKKKHQKVSGMIYEPSLALCLVSPSAVMMRRSLFDLKGRFDEDLPACEDYDLWLRVGCDIPVHFIPEPLVVKRGGHADQLSRQPGLDRFRIYAICKMIDSGRLSADQRRASIRMLQKKCRIYAAGCRRRGRHQEAAVVTRLADRYGGCPEEDLHSRNAPP